MFWTVADARRFFEPKFQRCISEIRHITIPTKCAGEPNISLYECACIISSFPNLKTVKIRYDRRSRRLLSGMKHYEDERGSQRQESLPEQQDGVVRIRDLELLKMKWIGDYFPTPGTEALAPRLEEALRAQIAKMSSCEKAPWENLPKRRRWD